MAAAVVVAVDLEGAAKRPENNKKGFIAFAGRLRLQTEISYRFVVNYLAEQLRTVVNSTRPATPVQIIEPSICNVLRHCIIKWKVKKKKWVIVCNFRIEVVVYKTVASKVARLSLTRNKLAITFDPSGPATEEKVDDTRQAQIYIYIILYKRKGKKSCYCYAIQYPGKKKEKRGERLSTFSFLGSSSRLSSVTSHWHCSIERNREPIISYYTQNVHTHNV